MCSGDPPNSVRSSVGLMNGVSEVGIATPDRCEIVCERLEPGQPRLIREFPRRETGDVVAMPA